MNNDILLSTKFKSIGEDATVSMPSQIKALFGMNPQIDVRLIDYDYIGDAKDERALKKSLATSFNIYHLYIVCILFGYVQIFLYL